ncbi:spore germination protein KC [Natronobacillus azotifigens]|uniref:Ger(X)C family spore germination protein n=1 Tax=Natronobacillus azotifigens TaxID=472978 RepID=A0A9J6R9N4_9BACI|nr:Ger(x)C family spore germination protein [Natronobacillus azotifigens]MCZ0702070.1 Ger(x)C family spore germination protein [Natronobacillus azotifigens]
MRGRKYILIITIIVLPLTGCWSATELTDIIIATAIGVDKSEDGYRLSVQIINPGEIAGSAENTTRTATTTYTAEGKTIFEALRRMTTIAPRRIFLSHVQVVVISEEVAKEGIGKVLDFLVRDHEFRADFILLIARDYSAKNIVSVITPLERISANKITSSSAASEKYWAPTRDVELNELMQGILSPGREAVLSGIHILGDEDLGKFKSNAEKTEPFALLYINEIGVFKGDQLVGWLNEDESKGFNYITDNVTSTVGGVDCDDDGRIIVEVFRSDVKMYPKVDGNQVTMRIHADLLVNLGEITCDISTETQEDLRAIEEKIEENLNEIMQNTIEAAKKLEADIFGFGDRVRRSLPRDWERLEKDWTTHFLNTNILLQSTVNIRHSGMIHDPFMDDIKKKNQEE